MLMGMIELPSPRPLPLGTAIDAAGLNKSALAEAIGANQGTVSKWCHADLYLTQRPTPQMFLEIVRVLMLNDDMTRRMALWFEERYARGVSS